METTTIKKKITLATLKSFVKKNKENLFINVTSEFDGMVDGISYCNDGFQKAKLTEDNIKNTLGIQGAWLVGGSRNYFDSYEDDNYIGYNVYNCCGAFYLVIKK
jgi:hypothetical protein